MNTAIAVQEKPILFSGAMVRKIIEDLKTNTRRVIKPQPSAYEASPNVHPAKRDSAYFDSYCNAEKTTANPRGMSEFWCWWTPDNRQGPDWIRCPYGKPGDRLWVRETWQHVTKGMEPTKGCRLLFRSDDIAGHIDNGWRPSIHMPRWASRLTVEIVSVKVERVQDISEEDAIAEGAEMLDSGLECSQCAWTGYEDSEGVRLVEIGDEDSEFLCPECQEVCAHHPIDEQYRWGFHRLWDSINAKREGGKYAWAAHPWVWAIEFRRLDT